MTASSNSKNRNLFSFLKRGEDWLEISGYHVGDVQTDQPVAVVTGANMVGNIIAPKVSVAGLVYGSTVSLETTVEAEGQIWGDVYTATLHVNPGGKIQGWVSALNENSYQTIKNEGVIPDVNPTQGPFEVPAEGGSLVRSETQIGVLRRLQAEAAAAMAARAELEHTFEKRLSEVAGDSSTKIETLSGELMLARSEIKSLQEKLDNQQDTLLARDTQIDRQNQEIVMTRDLLEKQTAELGELQEAHEKQTAELETVNAQRDDLITQLQETQMELDAMGEKLQSREVTLAASLQHTADQEESLLRWQELAEVTEKRAKELETELQNVKFQLDESANVTEMLREQRRQIEEEWQKTVDELNRYQRKETQPLARVSDPAPELIVRIAELEAELQEAKALEKELEKAQEANTEQNEQLLWYTANLKTSQAELEAVRETAVAQKEQIGDLRDKLAQQEKLTEEWQQQVDKWQKRARRLQAEIEQLKSHADQSQGQSEQFSQKFLEKEQQIAAVELKLQEAEQAKKELKEKLRQTKVQMDGHEHELERYTKQFQEQGHRVAELHNLVITRDAQLGELQLTLREQQTKLQKQSALLKQIKAAASKRINQQSQQLEQAKKQIHDMKAVLDRRGKH